MSDDEILRLLPKIELHCHFASTMSAAHLVTAADRYGVPLASADPATLFDFADLQEFLVAFRAAHRVLRTPADLTTLAYDGVRAVRALRLAGLILPRAGALFGILSTALALFA